MQGNNPATEFLSREKTVSEHISALTSLSPGRDAEPHVGAACTAAAHLLDTLAAHHDALQQSVPLYSYNYGLS